MTRARDFLFLSASQFYGEGKRERKISPFVIEAIGEENVNKIIKKEPITLYGDGLQTRSLCYIDDLINGLMKFMFAEDLSGEIINIGNTDEHTVKEFAEIIKKEKVAVCFDKVDRLARNVFNIERVSNEIQREKYGTYRTYFSLYSY
jgi:nucleoside-diphosphate-sugar epimerase